MATPMHRKVEELREELCKLTKAAEECQVRLPGEDDLTHALRVVTKQREIITAFSTFAYGMTWCLRAADKAAPENWLAPDFVRASFTGRAEGLTFGMIWRDDKGLPQWGIHT